MTTMNSSSKKSNATKKSAKTSSTTKKSVKTSSTTKKATKADSKSYNSKSSNNKKQPLSAQQKKNLEHLLNNLTVDAAVSYMEDGSVCIHVAPWNEHTEITEQPKTIRGRMVYGGKYHEGDGGKFIPYNQGGASIFTTILKTPHGELKTTPKRVQMQFSFWKSEGMEKTMTELYKEVMQMKKFVKSNLMKYNYKHSIESNLENNITWEEMK